MLKCAGIERIRPRFWIVRRATQPHLSPIRCRHGAAPRKYAGAQLDHARVLDVVTGEGNFGRCSTVGDAGSRA